MKKLFLLLLVPNILLGQVDYDKVVRHTMWQTTQNVTYDNSYVKIDYPWGDVHPTVGVCTDVVIRAFRADSIDLQSLIHEDMKKYPSNYNVPVLDRNIDHRRCKNIRNYYKRRGYTLPITNNPEDYKPGDLVFWSLGIEHVGIVVKEKVYGTNRHYVVHNVGAGPQMDDFLFAVPIIYHGRMK
jgi:uncharacterized protein YijF (DUF1287 family)